MKLDHYDLVEKINEGGSGIIYKSVNTQTGALVAVKLLNKTFQNNTTALNKFLFEANQYLYLDHPNIVRLLDFNTKTQTYLVQEYIEGYNLEDYINKVTGPISVSKAQMIMVQVLEAIDYAHSNNVLHLDLKPSNIMINTKTNTIKILDFGIAQNQDEPSHKMFIGSPYFMSPEQVQKKPLNQSSDIYSLGVTLYYLVTGQVPFPKKLNKEQVFDLIIKGNLDKASSKYLPVSKEVEYIILKATALKAERRFNSCNDFKKSMEKIIIK